MLNNRNTLNNNADYQFNRENHQFIVQSRAIKYSDTVFNPDLTCGVCLFPPFEPIIHLCGTFYCKSCVESNNINCTICQTLITSPFTQAPNYINRVLDSILTYCEKCNTLIKRGDVYCHQQECTIDCPDGCGEKVKPFVNEDLYAHSDICINKQYVCSAQDVYCKFKGTKLQLFEHEAYCDLLKYQNILLSFKQGLSKQFESKLAELNKEIASLKELNNNSLRSENLALKEIILSETALDAKNTSNDCKLIDYNLDLPHTPTITQIALNSVSISVPLQTKEQDETQLHEIQHTKKRNTRGSQRCVDNSDDCNSLSKKKKKKK